MPEDDEAAGRIGGGGSDDDVESGEEGSDGSLGGGGCGDSDDDDDNNELGGDFFKPSKVGGARCHRGRHSARVLAWRRWCVCARACEGQGTGLASAKNDRGKRPPQSQGTVMGTESRSVRALTTPLPLLLLPLPLLADAAAAAAAAVLAGPLGARRRGRRPARPPSRPRPKPEPRAAAAAATKRAPLRPFTTTLPPRRAPRFGPPSLRSFSTCARPPLPSPAIEKKKVQPQTKKNPSATRPDALPLFSSS